MNDFEAKLIHKIIKHPGDNFINILAGEKRNETYMQIYYSVPILGDNDREKRILIRKMKIFKKRYIPSTRELKKIEEKELISRISRKFSFDFLYYTRWDMDWHRAYQYLATTERDIVNGKKFAVFFKYRKYQRYYRFSEDHFLFFPRAIYCPDEFFDEPESWLYRCENVDRPIISSHHFRYFIKRFFEEYTDAPEHIDIEWLIGQIGCEPNDWIIFTLSFIGLKNRILQFLENSPDEDFRIAIQIRKAMFAENKKNVSS